MFKILHLIRYDKDKPIRCISRWWYVQNDKCKCINVCKYNIYTKQQWKEVADKSYPLIYTKWTKKRRMRAIEINLK